MVQEMFPALTPVALEAVRVGARLGKPLPAEAAYIDSAFWRRGVAALSAEDVAAAARATSEAVRAAAAARRAAAEGGRGGAGRR